MKKILLVFVLISIITQLPAQQLVNITTSPKTVPAGKKWVLKIDGEVLTDLSDLSLRDGNLCNVQLRSNTRSLGSIIEGEIGRPRKIYKILFDDIEKVSFSSDRTYSITPLSFEYYTLEMSDYAGTGQIIFYPGEKVFVSTCLNSIEMEVIDLTQNEITNINRKKIELKKHQESKELERIKEEERYVLEREEKIKNSNHYFSYYELDNGKNIKLEIDSKVLPMLYSYLKEYSKDFPSEYASILKYYNSRVEQAKYNPRGDADKISQFNFSFYFDKSGQLKNLTRGIDRDGSSNSSLGLGWLSKIRPLISIDSVGQIALNGRNYEVNTIFHTDFKIEYSNQVEVAVIKISKKLSFKIFKNNTSIDNDILTEIIEKQGGYKNLKPGNYEVKIKSNDVVLKLWSSHDYGSDKSFVSSKVSNDPDLKFELYEKETSLIVLPDFF
ncbi:hypothetical protein [Algoriphagus sp.]|uniref:hypothetical protein n=1 Tax=Algoriphagus sp. TaxID=1872435 RepID=UPI002729042F|nr:hypothetical protein [Algoriphagus sp.]MDO8965064.1 hypothetical protein [Algoriphagus sp.]MDP3201873.1 hypothetical protein [Algoriphagus sp.]